MSSRRRGSENRQKPEEIRHEQSKTIAPADFQKAERAAEVLVATIKQDPQILEKPEFRRVVQVFRKHHSGPLPCPEDYAEYERVLPGSANRILQMAEASLSSFQKLTSRNLELDYKEGGRGQIFAFVLALVAILVGGILVYVGHDIGGSILSVGGLTTLVVAFIQGKKRE